MNCQYSNRCACLRIAWVTGRKHLLAIFNNRTWLLMITLTLLSGPIIRTSLADDKANFAIDFYLKSAFANSNVLTKPDTDLKLSLTCLSTSCSEINEVIVENIIPNFENIERPTDYNVLNHLVNVVYFDDQSALSKLNTTPISDGVNVVIDKGERCGSASFRREAQVQNVVIRISSDLKGRNLQLCLIYAISSAFGLMVDKSFEDALLVSLPLDEDTFIKTIATLRFNLILHLTSFTHSGMHRDKAAEVLRGELIRKKN